MPKFKVFHHTRGISAAANNNTIQTVTFTRSSDQWTTGVGQTDNSFKIVHNSNISGNDFVISTSGDIGIGITTPTSRFDVRGGDIKLGITGILFDNSTGFVGIGITDDGSKPEEQLHVIGNIKGNNLILGSQITYTTNLDFVSTSTGNIALSIDKDTDEVRIFGVFSPESISSSFVDPLIRFSKNNLSDNDDIGFYGHYVSSGITKFTGFYRDASNGGKYKLFRETQENLSKTGNVINTSATGFDFADLEINSIDIHTGITYGNNTMDLDFFAVEMNRITFDTNGNVGIGTNIPGNKLDVRNGDVTVGVTIFHVDFEKSRIGINTVSPNVSLHVNGTDAIYLPTGTFNERPVIGVTKGYIRYNTISDSFEGYGAGNVWGSLGSLIDIDQDTKIEAEANPDEDKLRFTTVNTERMIIDENGNVGIGTDNPGSRLDVRGADVTLGVTVLHIDFETSRLGIATVSPNVSLHINSTDALYLPTGTSNERPVLGVTKGYIRYNTTLDKFEGFGVGNSWISLKGLNDVDQDTKIEVEASPDEDKLRFTTAGTERMIIDENVGIGINPTSILHVYESSENTTPLFQLENDSTGDVSMTFIGEGNTFTMGIDNTDDSFKISDNTVLGTNDRLIIDTSGEVGIGIAPTQKLHVNGNILTNFIYFNDTQESINSNGTDLVFRSSNIERMRIEGATGHVGIGSTNPSVSLDINFTDAIALPTGTTDQRPSGVNGYLRYNTSTGLFEGYDNGWAQFRGPTGPTGPTGPIGSGFSNFVETATNNLGFGENALNSISTGDRNTAVGVNALFSMSSSSNNTAFGYNALKLAITTDNTAVGSSSMESGSTSGDGLNTAIGALSLKNITTGALNVAVGYNALGNITTGSNNIAIGNSAGSSIGGTRSNNICIGHIGVSSDIGKIRIGNSTDHDSVTIGYSTGGTTYDFNMFGATACKSSGTTWISCSDQRIKRDIFDKNIKESFDSINALQLRNYKYESWYEKSSHIPENKEYIGFITQELIQIYPNAVDIIEGDTSYDVDIETGVTEIRNTEIGVTVVNIQKITNLQTIIDQDEIWNNAIGSIQWLSQNTVKEVNSSIAIGITHPIIGVTIPVINLAIGDINTGLNYESEHGLAIYTSGTERLRVTSDGNVGIGITNPDQVLSILGNASKTVAGEWLQISDERVKENITMRKTRLSLENINKLQVRKFDFIDEWMKISKNKHKTHIGLIAQELENSYPRSVYTSEKFGYIDFKSIESSDIRNDMIGAIQELSKKIINLEKNNLYLRNEILKKMYDLSI